MSVDVDVETLPGLLAQIVMSVFETMIRLPVEQGVAERTPHSDRLIASVHLAGEWTGGVLVECEASQARRFAAHFLSDAPGISIDDVVHDVIGELANMIGGNFKCLLTPGIRLSSPVVINGGDYEDFGPDAVRKRLAFQSPEGPFWVTLVSSVANVAG